MKILHTADWHLGKKLDYYPRLEEQKEVLEEIVAIAETQAVDLVVVAGDLFDTFNPSNEASELLYKSLKKLTRNGKVPVVAIAGNHDSPDRVNVADVLARENGIIFIGYPTDIVPLFELEDSFKVVRSEPGFVELELSGIPYPVRLLHTAFANETRLKEYLGQDKQASLQEHLQQKWQALAEQYCDTKGVNLLTTHLFMAKKGQTLPEEPEGEKPLNIGNADLVTSDAIPDQIQYAALGHLHRYQDVGVAQPVVYSSSPLAYSFSEAGQQKYVVLVTLEPGQKAGVERIPLQSGRPLIRKEFDRVTEAVDWMQAHPDCLLELTIVKEKFITAEERKMLYQNHSGIIYLIPKSLKTPQKAQRKMVDRRLSMDELFRDYFRSKNEGQEPNEELMVLFQEIKKLKHDTY